VALPPLRNAELRQIDDLLVHRVTEGLQHPSALECGSAYVMDDRWDVLDENSSWSQDLSRSSDPHIQTISMISASGVVVEVGVSLARRSSEQHVDPAGLVHEVGFSCSQRLSESRAEDTSNVFTTNSAPGEVRLKDIGDGVV
jgi:hypothetical protein